MTIEFGNIVAGALAPLAVALVLGLVGLFVPSVRWSRALRREAEIFNALPRGAERELWAERVEAKAARLRYHLEEVSLAGRVLGWVALAIVSVMVIYFVPLVQALGWPGLLSFGCVLLLVGPPAVRTFLGLPLVTRATPEMREARRRVKALDKSV